MSLSSGIKAAAMELLKEKSTAWIIDEVALVLVVDPQRALADDTDPFLAASVLLSVLCTRTSDMSDAVLGHYRALLALTLTRSTKIT